jgi:hypothetical protein
MRGIHLMRCGMPPVPVTGDLRSTCSGGCRLAAVTFRITRHSGSASPDDAIELLWRALPARHEDAKFTKVGSEIRVRWGDTQASSGREESAEVGRIAVLDIMRGVCERTPDLDPAWFAVSFRL